MAGLSTKVKKIDDIIYKIRVCPKCGKANVPMFRICRNCGRYIDNVPLTDKVVK